MTNNFERRTIGIQHEIETKIRELQGNLIKSDSKCWTYSKVVNAVLLAGIVGSESLNSSEWLLIKRLIEGGDIKLDCSIEEYIERLSKVS